MRLAQSPLLYLLIFCALHSTLSQLSVPVADDFSFFNYLVQLNQVFFQGPWRSTSDSQPFAEFEESSGFFNSDVNNDCMLSSAGAALSMTLFDGKYVDGGFMNISLCSALSSSFSFNAENATLSGNDLKLNVFGEDSSKNCSSNVSIFFIDMNLDGPMTDLKTHDDRIEDMGIQLAIASSECSFSVVTNVLTPGESYDSDKTQLFGIVYGFLLLFGGLLFIIISCRNDATLAHPQISPVTLYWRYAWALFFYVNVAISFSKGNPSKPPSIFAFPFITGVLEYVCVLIFAYRNFKGAAERCASVLVMIALLIIFFIARNFSETWVYILSSLCYVPQIIKIYQSGEKRKFSIGVIFIFMPSQLFQIGYFWMNPENFARWTPIPAFFGTYIGLVGLQVIILILQGKEWKSVYHTHDNERKPVQQDSRNSSPEL